jgi:multiple sugar transport system permease protein
MISPVIFYNVILTVIMSFQYYTTAMVIGGRNGDPQGATLFYNLHFYRETFVFNDMGYGSVLALLLFVIIMVLTALMFGILQRGVHYTSSSNDF